MFSKSNNTKQFELFKIIKKQKTQCNHKLEIIPRLQNVGPRHPDVTYLMRDNLLWEC